MTDPLLTLDGVGFLLADGRPLFADLHETFDRRRTGLVGRNGIGKSVLGRVLAGELPPSSGRVRRQGRVFRLAQQAEPAPGATLAQLAGVADALAALQRLEAGNGDEADLVQLADRWDLRQRHEAVRAELAGAVHEAAGRVAADVAIVVPPLPVAVLPHEVLDFDGELPFVAAPLARVQLRLHGAARLAVCGPNGCGKSTLLQVLAGRLAPRAGQVERRVRHAWLDQRLAGFDGSCNALELLRPACRQRPEAELRTRLAQLALGATALDTPCAALSGGERLKLALAHALLADEPARLLLLDEPGNHLDVAALEALEAMLRSWRGALVVVSHDEAFLAALAIEERLDATPEGWRRRPF